ncbi:MAG: GTPase ObgE [Candidatus Spechtbacterales bacterium]
MLIDDITIRVKSGKGGDGLVAFNKNMKTLGPTGGSGGRGGSLYFECISNISALNRLRYKKVFEAENGKNGQIQLRDGAAGEDLVIQVPIGTVIHNLTSGNDQEIVKLGEQVLIAKGGRGGKGNFHFRGPRNTSPKQFQFGKPGETYNIRLELKLIADIGLIGLPNAGKSSLLNELTSAKSKVGNYAFTTLAPNLGAYYELILADIPGLIEGSSSGRGLGFKFLRHIERTKILFHLISAESPNAVESYRTIRNELGLYNKLLLQKQEYVFLTKSDLFDAPQIQEKVSELKKINPTATALSIYDLASVNQVEKILNRIKDEK